MSRRYKVIWFLIALASSPALLHAQWYDITQPPYNASCNGTHDDTSAIQAALNAANSNGGGRVVVPMTVTSTCVFLSQLDLDGFVNVSLEGLGSTAWNNKPAISYGGSGSTTAISMRSTTRVVLQNLVIEYTNSGFTGMLIDTEHSGSGLDSVLDTFQGLDFSGPGADALCLICGDKSTRFIIANNNFNAAKNAIQGTAASGSYANSWTIRDNNFNSAANISLAFLQNPSADWNIYRNTFELGDGVSSSVTVLDNSTTSCAGCEFAGNWAGDAESWTGTIIKNFGTGGQGGIHISGNWIEGCGAGGSCTFMSIYAGGTAGITITGNLIGYFGTGVDFTGSSARSVSIYSNFGLSVTGAPTSGMVQQDTVSGNPTTVYGDLGLGTASPAHTLEVIAGGTTLADAWTIRSSRALKTNIRPLFGALEKVEQLQGVSYDRRIDGKHEIGVVAEDVAKVVPEVVSHDPRTNHIDGVDYSRLAALLIEAVKSQQKEILGLRTEIKELKDASLKQ